MYYFHLVVKNNWDALHVIGLCVLRCTCESLSRREFSKEGEFLKENTKSMQTREKKGNTWFETIFCHSVINSGDLVHFQEWSLAF